MIDELLDSPEVPSALVLRVVRHDERQPITFGRDKRTLMSSGATYFYLNNARRSSVKHTTRGTWVCLDSTCLAYYRAVDPRGKGCEHTRCAMAYDDARGGDTIERDESEGASE